MTTNTHGNQGGSPTPGRGLPNNNNDGVSALWVTAAPTTPTSPAVVVAGEENRNGGNNRGGVRDDDANKNYTNNASWKLAVHPKFKEDVTDLGVLKGHCFDSGNIIESNNYVLV